MHTNKLQVNFFYAILLVSAAAIFFIFLPFWKPLFLAAVLAAVFFPVNKKIRKIIKVRFSHTLAAFATLVIILLVILIPFVGVSYLVFEEATSVFSNFADPGQSSLLSTITTASEKINSFFPFEVIPPLDSTQLQDNASVAYKWLLDHVRVLFSGVFAIGLDVFILIFALFFFLRDGHRIKQTFIDASPLRDAYDEEIIDKLEVAVGSVVKGKLFIAILQGCLAALGFAIFGVPSPVLWGAVAVVAAIVPSFGTALIVMPAALYLWFQGEAASAIGLAIWGTVIVGLIDNVLGPVLMKRGINIHPFLILLSVLGGLALFGPVGFLAGPIILSLFFALIHIYPMVTRKRG